MEISVLVNGISATCRVTKTTTCSDLIKMAPPQTGCGDRFAVYERSQGVDRLVSAHKKVLKLVRSWGADRGLYTLIIRPLDKMPQREVAMTTVKKSFRRLKSRFIAVPERATCQKFENDVNMNLCTNYNSEKIFNKNIDVNTSEIDNEAATPTNILTNVNVAIPTSFPEDKLITEAMYEHSAKFYLLKRFIKESSAYASAVDASDADSDNDVTICLPPRTCGDGADAEDLTELKDVDRPGLMSASCDNANRTYVVSGYDLDEAFVSEESSCISSDETSSLNIGCVKYDIPSSESAFGDDSECSSICELEMNIHNNTEADVTYDITSGGALNAFTTSDHDNTYGNLLRLRAVFSNGDLDACVDDTALDSFMVTRVMDSGSDGCDEGLSSLGSDY